MDQFVSHLLLLFSLVMGGNMCPSSPRVLRTHTYRHSGRRTAFSTPEAIYVLKWIKCVVRGFVLCANFILVHSQCWFCQVSAMSLIRGEDNVA